jgi:uracil-DNA glycosylase
MAVNNGSAASYLPEVRTLPVLAAAAQQCRGCELYRNATQAVFGEGPEHASVLMAGEQPGDKEDLAGKPFVGPAGKVLAEALEAAGIDRREVYITNAVKHFKFEPRGKRRIHKKPDAAEIRACLPWLEAEVELVRPRIIVCLGATAAQALLGRDFKLTQHRGELFDSRWSARVTATVHPSSLLRILDPAGRRAGREAFVQDLIRVREAL